MGNKIDLPKDKWQVTQEEIDELCNKKKLKFYATSAKENKGINEAFTYISNVIYKKLEDKKPKVIVIGKDDIKNNNQEKKKKCC